MSSINNINVLVPLAGLGSRFQAAGFTFPKPLVDIEGSPMIAKVVKNLIDYKYKDEMRKWYEHLFNSQNDAEIMVFKATHPKWSYVRLDKEEIQGETEVTGTKEDRVTEVQEKKVISQWATTGIYYWKEGREFVESAETMISNNIRVNEEFYIAPTFNEMILKSKKIGKFEVPTDSFYGIGTPEDLQTYLNRVKLAI